RLRRGRGQEGDRASHPDRAHRGRVGRGRERGHGRRAGRRRRAEPASSGREGLAASVERRQEPGGHRTRSRRHPEAGAVRRASMSISEPFIRRPVATTLLMIGLLLAGLLGFHFLPISALPQVDYPTIVVSTFLPGASADTMASSVTTP